MTPEERERLAVVETRLKLIDHKVDAVVLKVDTLMALLNQIRGGKSAMWVIWSVVGGVIALAASLFGAPWLKQP